MSNNSGNKNKLGASKRPGEKYLGEAQTVRKQE